MTPEKAQEFLDELTILSVKYGITIGGCGCCGSPWIEDLSSSKHYVADDLDLADGSSTISFYKRTTQ